MEVSVDNLRETVRFLSAIDPPRNYRQPESLDAVKEYIKSTFEEHGLTAREQRFEAAGRTYANVVATLAPERPERLVVGAHYDVAGEIPGADDNASAVAGLLELARLAKAREAELPYRVEFVAYCLEEPPFFATPQMGSSVHARSLRAEKAAVRGMICLEMLGYFTDAPRSQSYPLPGMGLLYPSQGNFIAVVGNGKSKTLLEQVRKHLKVGALDVQSLSAPSLLTGVDFSDHRNYWELGYQAVMVTDTAFFRNPHYHEASDTIDTLDFDRMADVVRGLNQTLLKLDDQE